MTLRLRLVIGLAVLVTVGLTIFGFTTYRLYRNSEYNRLDDQLRNSVPGMLAQLHRNESPNGSGSGTTLPTFPEQSGGGGGGGRGGPPIVAPPGTYGELRDASGAVVTRVQASNSDSQPKLAKDLRAHGGKSELFTTGSTTGSGDWRVYVAPEPNSSDGESVVVAVPTSGVTSSLNELVVIELASAGGLLVLLALGSWLILRRGLRPLERMATSARTIAAGDLSQRVEPADDKTEVGQLGLALNTMLTEIEAAFREREATERKLRQFLADASHELRTPLTSIQGFAELFRLGADQDRVQLEVILRRIEEETARMKTLVEDLLLLARLDETRPVERAPVDLAVLAADACSDAIAVDPQRPIVLDAPEPVVVAGDQDHLRQAIANLVNNALRHTRPASPIEVGAHLEHGAAYVTVRDHGPGLDPEALAHVFDRFWQADAARVGSGAGLGLSIVAGIAAEHGGTATANNHPDGGAVFTLQLPIDAPAPVAEPVLEPAPAPAP
jgi:two-component system, OmpR family, sensor kinase